MLKIKQIKLANIVRYALIILAGSSCTKDQNTFVPYTKVNLSISLVNYNHLMIPGNSVLFQNEGYRGIIVVCVDPNSSQYFAYDACCPYEKDYSGIVMITQIKNLTSPPYTIFSSDFFGICNKCGSQFNLIGYGQPVKGPATHYLQTYNIITGFQSLTVTN